MNIARYISACIGSVINRKSSEYHQEYIVIDGKTFYLDEIINWSDPKRTETLVDMIEHGSIPAVAVLEETRKKFVDHDSPEYIRKMIDSDVKESKQNDEIDKIFAREFVVATPRWMQARNFKDYLKVGDFNSVLHDIERSKDRKQALEDALFILTMLHNYGVGALAIVGQVLFAKDKILGTVSQISYAIPESEAWRRGMCGESAKKAHGDTAKAYKFASEDVKYMINNCLHESDRNTAEFIFAAIKNGPKSLAKSFTRFKDARYAKLIASKLLQWLAKSAGFENSATYRKMLREIDRIPDFTNERIGEEWHSKSGKHKIEYEYDGKFICRTNGADEFEMYTDSIDDRKKFDAEHLKKNPSVSSKYKTGFCDAYAIAMHRIFGYKIFVVRGFYKLYGEWEIEDSHMVVKDKNKFIDVDGAKSSKELIYQCMFTCKVEKVKLVEVSEEEAKFIFTCEGVSDEQISEAIDFIKNRLHKNPGDIEVKPQARTANAADINKKVLDSANSAMVGARARFSRAKQMLELARIIRDKNRLIQAEKEMEEAENGLSFYTRKYNDALTHSRTIKKNGNVERYLSACGVNETVAKPLPAAKPTVAPVTMPAALDPGAKTWANDEIRKVAIFEIRKNRDTWSWLSGITGSQILELAKIIANALSSSIRSDNARKKRLGLGVVKFSEKIMSGFMAAQSRTYCGLVMQ